MEINHTCNVFSKPDKIAWILFVKTKISESYEKINVELLPKKF